MSEASVLVERREPLVVVTINRPQARNAVDGPTAQQLAEAFRAFDADDALRVAILTGAGGHFCAGADLKALGTAPARANRIDAAGDGPMGPSRLHLSKPVIAAVSGYAVAGGIELACWCDLRVADVSAVFGVFCRRFGVPLIDGGTVRLPRLIGMSRALDLILTGRAVDAQEAYAMGLANRVVPAGQALAEAEKLALQIAAFPQQCMRNDRASAYEQWGMTQDAAIANEFERGLATLKSGESLSGATRFAGGDGRHGKF
ncbi:crotonase/enoyl-CoA hydratase family protein [Sinimarinibacterium flocculans]|uniref:Enoyl-CoA hydratase n=1 Tax=Sinimarinibacterium flocculans TaxID=985250 RepID=A0A318EN06_9GAMM|nr:crotonase/enoyl-CoA hydratase family protein [Sinimarinibacterium flocculans]PXV70600.1 enoyl-CoA hydratase [Sinimarinibacterium flocculans]